MLTCYSRFSWMCGASLINVSSRLVYPMGGEWGAGACRELRWE